MGKGRGLNGEAKRPGDVQKGRPEKLKKTSGAVEKERTALQEADPFLRGVIDALPANLAILDSKGKISAVNDQWKRFARDNGLDDVESVDVGANYLEVCGRAAMEGDALAEKTLHGIRAILEGRSKAFSVEYPCHSPQESRWFVMKAAAFRTEEDQAVVLHMDITQRKQAEEEVQKANDLLEQRVGERTTELTRTNEQLSREIVERQRVEDELRKALLDIEQYRAQLEAECTYLREEIRSEHNFDQIIGQSDALRYVLFKVNQIAASDTTVLILGESGTGKELIARAIHSASPRRDRPLVKVNCAALPSNLIESELFGHERGAFTGALTRQVGRFEVAHGGTLFLDEIGELPLELQAKLLRVLQDKEFERLGSHRTIQTDVRIIAATNRNLEEETRNGHFRQDLWYRINVFPITVPALRQRKEDIPLLANAFVGKLCKKLGKNIRIIPQHILETLQKYPWPGNVRELENVMERAVISTEGPVLELSDHLVPVALEGESEATGNMSLEEVERKHILRILEQTRWKIEGKGGAASILGLNPSTLRGRLRKLGISRS